jgi:hypothetical protein
MSKERKSTKEIKKPKKDKGSKVPKIEPTPDLAPQPKKRGGKGNSEYIANMGCRGSGSGCTSYNDDIQDWIYCPQPFQIENNFF